MFLPVLLVLSYVLTVYGNLEGPFLFFGPESLEKYKRPALKNLDQDDLMRIYGEEAAIVVFNNQDSVPLASGNFPRLRKMLEGLTTLVLPQDFLDVHPDYISNETQMLTLQGPWSERDAQMTETFARLQDIYGSGRVLGILGNSVSQGPSLEYSEPGSWARARREADASAEPPAEDEKPPKVLQRFALYNATGPPGRSALLYSTGWPEIRWANGSVTVLDTPVGEPTVKPTRLYTILVVRFADGDSRDKITLEFSFKQSAGWWQAVGVEVKFGVEPTGLNLKAPSPPDAPSAVLGHSYECSLPLEYSSEEATLLFPDVLMQPFMDNTEKFSDAFNCIGFTTVPIWCDDINHRYMKTLPVKKQFPEEPTFFGKMLQKIKRALCEWACGRQQETMSGLFVSSMLIAGLVVSISMILDIKTMDRFENNRSKQLTITVSE